MQPGTSPDIAVAAAHAHELTENVGSVVAQTNERLDAEIGAAHDRLDLLVTRLTTVLRMASPQPTSEGERVSHDSLVGDHSSLLAQEQYTRCHRVGALTYQINDLLDRLEI